MSWQRFQRGVRNLGGYSGGTSRLARPVQRLPEPDIRPGRHFSLVRLGATNFGSGGAHKSIGHIGDYIYLAFFPLGQIYKIPLSDLASPVLWLDAVSDDEKWYAVGNFRNVALVAVFRDATTSPPTYTGRSVTQAGSITGTHFTGQTNSLIQSVVVSQELGMFCVGFDAPGQVFWILSSALSDITPAGFDPLTPATVMENGNLAVAGALGGGYALEVFDGSSWTAHVLGSDPPASVLAVGDEVLIQFEYGGGFSYERVFREGALDSLSWDSLPSVNWPAFLTGSTNQDGRYLWMGVAIDGDIYEVLPG